MPGEGIASETSSLGRRGEPINLLLTAAGQQERRWEWKRERQS